MIPCPPLAIQQKITDFLQKKCTEIDNLISDIKEQIQTLEQYKKSVITEAVTKGLDKNATMKDSGVEWIGAIPRNWDIAPTKYQFNFSKGLSITKENLEDEGVKVISYGQVHSKTNTGTHITEDLFRFVNKKYKVSNSKCLVNKGDFIFADTSEDLDGVGNCVHIDKQMELFAGYHTIIAKPNNYMYSKFFAYVFLTDLWRSQLRVRASGVKVLTVSQKIIKETSIVIPSVDIAMEISEYLDDKRQIIRESIQAKQQQITTLEEYKKSVIFEYVTGKKEIL